MRSWENIRLQRAKWLLPPSAWVCSLVPGACFIVHSPPRCCKRPRQIVYLSQKTAANSSCSLCYCCLLVFKFSDSRSAHASSSMEQCSHQKKSQSYRLAWNSFAQNPEELFSLFTFRQWIWVCREEFVPVSVGKSLHASNNLSEMERKRWFFIIPLKKN